MVSAQHRKFHDIPWDDGETLDYFRELYDIAGLPRLEGQGLVPPMLDKSTRWAIEHTKKYPVPGDGRSNCSKSDDDIDDGSDKWTIIRKRQCRDSLHFI